jgi:hypothetical protein
MVDSDPLDAVEISSRSLELGSVTPVKVLGAFAMLDDGELDWKVLTINRNDPLYSQLNDVADVQKVLPGFISGLSPSFASALSDLSRHQRVVPLVQSPRWKAIELFRLRRGVCLERKSTGSGGRNSRVLAAVSVFLFLSFFASKREPVDRQKECRGR